MLDFYFAHEELFVLPIEALTDKGLCPAFAEDLKRCRGISEAWVNTFNRAFGHYWNRARALHAAAPDDWYPPRKQNICMVADPTRCRPYSHPFPGSSWLLFQSDFAPGDEDPELATYLFFHAERTAQSRSALNAFIHNISYFNQLDDEQLRLFQKQCSNCTRPDAAAFEALATFLASSPQIFHPNLNPLPPNFDARCGRIDGANVLLRAADAPLVQQLAKTIQQDGEAIVERHYQQHRGSSPNNLTQLSDWLAATTPKIQIRIADDIAWDPMQGVAPEMLHQRLQGMSQRSCLSLLEDLKIIHSRSCRFLESLQDLSCLPKSDVLEQEGSLYIDSRSHCMVYSLSEPNLNLLNEPTPPYGRWLLGARTVHEWAHLAVEADLVEVPAENKEQEQTDREAVATILRAIVQRATGPCRTLHDHELQQIAPTATDPGAAWCDYLFTRMADFQSNLLLPQFAEPVEVESYVRLNARCHNQDTVGLYKQLMRYAFESQYLRLCSIRNPLEYLLDSIWFEDFFVVPGIIKKTEMAELYHAVGEVCSHQTIRSSAFDPALRIARQDRMETDRTV
jgi:hypothetical protein